MVASDGTSLCSMLGYRQEARERGKLAMVLCDFRHKEVALTLLVVGCAAAVVLYVTVALVDMRRK